MIIRSHSKLIKNYHASLAAGRINNILGIIATLLILFSTTILFQIADLTVRRYY